MLLALVVAAGCARHPAATPSAPPSREAEAALSPAAAAQLATGIRGVLDAMAAVVRARGGAACPVVDGGAVAAPEGGRCADCAAMAVDLGAVFDRSESLFAQARRARKDADSSAVLEAAMRAEGAGVQARVEEIASGLRPCVGNAELVRVIERMPVL